MKFLRQVSIFWIAALSALTFSIALGFISFRYYREKSSLVRFYKDEGLGVTWAESLAEELIEVATAQKLKVEQAGEALRLMSAADDLMFVKDAFKSEAAEYHFVKREDRGEYQFLSGMPANALLSSFQRQLIEGGISEQLRKILDQSNLILDPQFQTYHLVVGLYSWLPSVYSVEAGSARDSQVLQRAAAKEAKRSFIQALGDDAFAFRNERPELATFRKSLKKFSAEAESSIPNRVQLKELGLQVLKTGSDLFVVFNNERLVEARRSMLISLVSSSVLWLFALSVVLFLLVAVFSQHSFMLGVIKDQKEALVRTQKLSTLGEMSAGIGHDIASPLMVIRSSAESIEDTVGIDQALVLHAQRINRMVDRIDSIIKGMKNFLGKDQGNPSVLVNLQEVFQDVSLLTKQPMAAHGVDFSLKLDSGAGHVLGNESEYVQVFVNLVMNAIDAVKNGEQRKVSIHSRVDGSRVRLFVQDSGPGIPKSHREKIFLELFTTKPPGEGTGLGLSIAKRIVRKYGGDLLLLDAETGASFEINLPLATADISHTAPNTMPQFSRFDNQSQLSH